MNFQMYGATFNWVFIFLPLIRKDIKTENSVNFYATLVSAYVIITPTLPKAIAFTFTCIADAFYCVQKIKIKKPFLGLGFNNQHLSHSALF
jgi:hypothetical protein